jgi:hypothetical protein
MDSQPERFEVELWQNLKQHLKSEITIGPPAPHDVMVDTISNRTVPYEANKIKITVSNVAPINPDYPSIVFTGIVLSVLYDGDQKRINKFGWMQNLKIARRNPRPKPSPNIVISGQEFPSLTNDEQKFGDIIFPGQFVVYEMYIPVEETQHLKFHVEGRISRRHFFHVEQALPQ